MTIAENLQNVPPRHFHAMKPQPVIAWTLTRLARALAAWLMEESYDPREQVQEHKDRLRS